MVRIAGQSDITYTIKALDKTGQGYNIKPYGRRAAVYFEKHMETGRNKILKEVCINA